MSPSPYDWADEDSGDDYFWIEADEMEEFRKNVNLLAWVSGVAIAGLAALNAWFWLS